ncbi:H-type small acid-soluble spore protein [Paenibacillus spongiae]|uniref:H-type small acid-soluble spore protein n=1 Tax=Paenibacillus spongiae TaxID=2909671 RepID=A0ABY5S9L3_9BACL|nr:H-type small acid-soluble spore protein [Paenibacillus spongiae]UVI30611.1 H-type small acid-soluble spore protein [Paenibacillus spongiae]
MNKQRAQEISESPVMAQVTYQGTAVYIQHVDHDRETARIYPLNQKDQELEVSLDSLMEQ